MPSTCACARAFISHSFLLVVFDEDNLGARKSFKSLSCFALFVARAAMTDVLDMFP